MIETILYWIDFGRGNGKMIISVSEPYCANDEFKKVFKDKDKIKIFI